MFENFKNTSVFNQGLFVMLCGLAGVFLVLILFFFLIKILLKAFPEKNDKDNDDKKEKVIV
jgi:Na+-transporting methylmalonyl-CoA/oxaloacetate decarboxylase gamma subunit